MEFMLGCLCVVSFRRLASIRVRVNRVVACKSNVEFERAVSDTTVPWVGFLCDNDDDIKCDYPHILRGLTFMTLCLDTSNLVSCIFMAETFFSVGQLLHLPRSHKPIAKCGRGLENDEW